MKRLNIFGFFIFLIVFAIVRDAQCQRPMPIRNLIQRIRDRQAQENEILSGPGSNSLADSRSFSRGAQLGNLFGVTNTGSHVKTETVNNNDGSQNLAVNNALTNNVNLAGIPITNTFSGSRLNENGDRARKAQHQFSVGGLGFTSGLNSENRGTGFGVNREPGNAGFHLGPLSFQLMNNGGLLGGNRAGGVSQAQTNAAVTAAGDGSSTNAQTNSGSGGRNLGLLNLQKSFSNSQAIGKSLNGDTTADADALGLQQNFNTAGVPQTQEYNYDNQPGVGLFGRRRFKRSPQFFQDGRGPLRRLLFGPGPPTNQGGEYGPGFGPSPQFHGGRPGGFHHHRPGGFQNFNQNAGANTHSNNFNDPYGSFQNTGGSSQASNLAQDGSKGQISSANTAQEQYNTAQGSGNKNSAQGQSANFDNLGNIGLSNSNANTQNIRGPNGERNSANSGSAANLQNQFGTQASGAQSDTQAYNENGLQGSKGNSQANSVFTGNNGELSNSNSGANTNSYEGPNGVKGSSASSQASNVNNGGGGNTGSSASAGSGTGGFGNQSFGNSGSFGGGTNTNSDSASNNYGSTAGGNANTGGQYNPYGYGNYNYGNQGFNHRRPGNYRDDRITFGR